MCLREEYLGEKEGEWKRKRGIRERVEESERERRKLS